MRLSDKELLAIDVRNDVFNELWAYRQGRSTSGISSATPKRPI